MSFNGHDIRRAMDVYTLDNAYLGTVLAVAAGPASAREQVAPDARQSSAVSGELMGPMPTGPLGNHAPRVQSAANQYATAGPDDQPLGAGTLTVGRWFGPLGRRTIPLGDVQTVSLERVVLRLRADELDQV